MNKLLKIAFVLGLIRAWQCAAVEPPPLPVNPGKPPVSVPGTTAKSLVAMWNVSSTAFDVLEISPCADFSSKQDVPGPYEVREINGILCYYVPVPVGYSKAFFRVRRFWGFPWIQ